MSTSKRAQFPSKLNARFRRKSAVGAGAVFNSLVFVQCLGLTAACANGEQLDHSPVSRITLAEASVPRPDAAVGSGGSVVTGSGGAVTGSGGAQPGKGGTAASGGMQGKGGGSAAGAGGAPSTGGKVGAGGTPATGGAGSGGALSSGGSASGGKASGGASAGGTSSGGSAGAGGGSGGSQNCKGYVDDDACSRCICQKCKSQVETCFASGETTKDQQCKAIQDCAETNHCASTVCLCGPNNPLCLGMNGKCVAPILAVAGQNATALQVQTLSQDTSNPIGRANEIGLCSQNGCRSECGL